MVNDSPADADVLTHFSIVRDPRSEHSRLHPMSSIVAIAICAIICGADSWVGVERWATAKAGWLETLMDLPNGVPSHDTFSRVFSIVNPKEFEAAFSSWIASVASVTEGEVVPIDGKTLRRSFDKASGRGPIHMVSAWAATAGVVLGQVKTDEKSNEITAIPALLRLLEIKGCIVTIDAMGCQKKIASAVLEGGGDYVLAVKENHPKLYSDIQRTFEDGDENEFDGLDVSYSTTLDKGHGRTEERTVWATGNLSKLRGGAEWPGIQSIARVQSIRTVDGQTTVSHRYYVSSLAGTEDERILDAVRRHWGIENRLHWSLDLAFREDECRIRTGHGAENMARLRHVALNLLRRETTAKAGIAIRRKMAGWDNDYLLRVLGVGA